MRRRRKREDEDRDARREDKRRKERERKGRGRVEEGWVKVGTKVADFKRGGVIDSLKRINDAENDTYMCERVGMPISTYVSLTVNQSIYR
jgi:hypothetical protein